MVVSINPLYKCNFECDFCYLSIEERKTKHVNPITNIVEHLDEISNTTSISHIDLYGGEISLLNDEYMIELIETSLRYTGSVSVVTNLYIVKDWMMDDRIQLSVSFDGSAREKHEQVFNNMFTLERDYNVIGLVSERFNIDEFISLTNILGDNCLSVELKPYSNSRFNSNVKLFDKFDKSVMRLIEESNKEVVNETRLKMSLSGLYSAFSDNHVYITPNNKVATLQFIDGVEYFQDYLSIYSVKKDYSEIITKECKACEYHGKCITEHYTDTDKPTSCSGHYNLMKEYEEKYFPKFLQQAYRYKSEMTEYDDIADDIGFVIKDIENIEIEFRDYLFSGGSTLVYPLKSFVVGVIYAVLIERDFQVPRREVLEYDVFQGTDRFFKKYSEATEQYDKLFETFNQSFSKIQKNDTGRCSDSVKKIIEYYNKEYHGTNNKTYRPVQL